MGWTSSQRLMSSLHLMPHLLHIYCEIHLNMDGSAKFLKLNETSN